MDAEDLLEEIRFHAEFVAKGAHAERSKGHTATRRLMENLEQLNNEADWNRSLVAERIAVLRERIASMAAIHGSQTWELDQHWVATTTALDSLRDALRTNEE